MADLLPLSAGEDREASPGLPAPPRGLEGITRFCGDITPYIRRDGTISPSWESEKIGYARVPAPMVLSWDPAVEIRRIRVHKRVVPAYEAAFRAVHEAGLWSFLRVFGGAYHFRVIRGGAKLSTHAFGLATDHDPLHNPLGEPPDRCAMPAAVVEIMTAFGFRWGGNFSGRKDCMHYQFAELY